MKSHRKALENVVCVLHNHADNHATNRVGTDQKQHQLVESSKKSVAALKFVCLQQNVHTTEAQAEDR